MNKLFSTILALCFCISPANAKLFNAEEFYLKNGMQVVVIENHKAPIVKHMLWYKSGATNDRLGKAGTAHLLEHLMFRGTKRVKDYSKVMADFGAESNAFTGYDYTAYHQLLDVSKLELAMALEADRMENLEIKKEDFLKERDIVFQERKQMVENDPKSYFFESMRRSLWQENPYARPVIGLEKEISALKIKDVERFYDKYYKPSNAVLVLAGDIDLATAKILAEKYYGGIEAKEVSNKQNAGDVFHKKETSLVMYEPKVEAGRFYKDYIFPKNLTDKSSLYAYALLAEYLGGGETSELYKKLVLETRKAAAVSVDYNYGLRGYGDFSVSCVLAKGVGFEEFVKAFDKAWLESINELNEKDLARIKVKLKAGMVYAKDDPNDAAYLFGSLLSVGMSVDEVEGFFDEMDGINANEVKKGLQKMVEVSSVQTAVIMPLKGEGK